MIRSKFYTLTSIPPLSLAAQKETEVDLARIADLAKGKLRDKKELLEKAVDGRLTQHHRTMIRLSLKHIGGLNQLLSQVELEINALLKPYSQQIELLTQILGVNRSIASVIVAEIGTDMSVFPSERHLSSWATLCPGNNESAGKRRSGRTRPGNRLLKSALTQAGWAASHIKNSYLNRKYWLLRNRRGEKRALIAIAHKILIQAYHILRDMQAYRELGPDYLDKLKEERTISRMVRTLAAKGYNITPPKPGVLVG